MSRVAYDNVGKTWKDLKGEVSGIHAQFVEGDYYFWVPSRQWLLRFYADWVGAEQALGVILATDGTTIESIRNFVHPDFKDQHSAYKSCLGWIQNEGETALTLVIHSADLKSFRVSFDLEDREYEFLGFDVR